MSEANDNAPKRRRKTIDDLRAALTDHSTPAPRPAPRRRRAAGHTVAGDGNVVGDNNSVTIIKTERVIRREKAIPKPGAEHITEEQMGKLHRLVDEIVRVEGLTKRDPATHPAVWKALATKMRVGSNRMIPLSKFSAAEAYLRAWLGRISGTASAKRNDDTLRKRRIAYIQTNMKKLDLEADVRRYMAERFGVSSLTELSIDDLEAVYRYVAGLKRRAAPATL